MVLKRIQPRILVKAKNKPLSNFRPRSVVMEDGQPKFVIHLSTNARATVSIDASLRGTASGHRVKRSMQVEMQLYP